MKRQEEIMDKISKLEDELKSIKEWYKISKYNLYMRQMKESFYEDIEKSNITRASEEWGISRSSAYRWKLEVEILKDLEKEAKCQTHQVRRKKNY